MLGHSAVNMSSQSPPQTRQGLHRAAGVGDRRAQLRKKHKAHTSIKGSEVAVKISALCFAARSIQILVWGGFPHYISFSVPFLLFKIAPIVCGFFFFLLIMRDGYSSRTPWRLQSKSRG